MAKLTELDLPEGIESGEDPVEFVRFWIAGNEDYVTLNIGAFDPEHEASSWGMIAADIVKHAMRGICQHDASRDKEALLAEIEAAFYGRLRDTVKISGQLRGEKH